MPRTRPAYTAECTSQIVELARSGRSIIQLAREFEPTHETICKGSRLVRMGDRIGSTYELIYAYQAEYSVAMSCRVLEVSTSGFYAWLKRPTSARTIEDRILTEMIKTYHKASYETYGAPRIHADLKMPGFISAASELPV